MPATNHYVITLCSLALGACSPFESLYSEPCEPAIYPGRASLPNIGDSIDFTVAVRRVDFGDSDDEDGRPAYERIGFDVDGACGEIDERYRCALPAWAGARQYLPGGRDNSIGELLYRRTKEGRASTTESVNSTSDNGDVTALLRVRKYNGASVDNDVEVDWFGGTRIPSPLVVALRPKWDGTDEWTAFKVFVESSDDEDGGVDETPEELAARYVDRDAYVTDHKLVARFPELLSISGVYSNAVLVAEIVEGDNGWRLTNGMAGARMHISQMLAMIASHTDPDTGQPICTDSPAYARVKKETCALVDVTASMEGDLAHCDAVSWAWRFDTAPALLAPKPWRYQVPPLPCADDVAPGNDTCESP